ncbi:MAG: copper resistance protein CopC [Microbacterium enclense]
MSNALVRTVAIAAIALGAVLGGAQAASAHDSLESTSPASGATVSSPSEVSLDFSANLLGYDGGNIVVVLGPDGRHYETDCVALSGSTLTAPVALGAAGEYQVEWRAVSSDGHPISGSFSFTSTTAGSSAGAGQSPCAAAVSAGGESSAASDTAQTGGMSGLTLGLVVGGGVVVLVGVVVVVILRTRSREE